METERRVTPRHRAYRPVRLRQPGGIPFVETLTKDLAGGGLRCLTPMPLPVATTLTVEIGISAEEPLEVRGRTAWLRLIPHSEQFDLGIAFMEMSPQSKRRLSAYLSRLQAAPGTETFKPSVNINIPK